jgi:methylmalonyl-CoA/ethylmalonyl-CoA epimerase
MTSLANTFSVGTGLAGSLGQRLHHIGLVVPSIAETIGELELWLGLQETTLPFDDQAQRVRVQFVHVGGGSFVELIEPTTEVSPISQFLTQRGGGLHHVAFEVEDFDEAVVRITRDRGRIVRAPWIGFEGRRLAFVIPRSGLRLLVELVEGRLRSG